MSEEQTQDTIDEGMAEGGRLAAIERRLIHVDRISEETLVQVRIGNSQTLSALVMIMLIGGMIYLISRQLKGVDFVSP